MHSVAQIRWKLTKATRDEIMLVVLDVRKGNTYTSVHVSHIKILRSKNLKYCTISYKEQNVLKIGYSYRVITSSTPLFPLSFAF